MPSTETLPDPLKPLSRRNAIEISHSRFNYDIERLITAIQKVLDATEARRNAEEERSRLTEETKHAQQEPERRRLEAEARRKAEEERVREQQRKQAEEQAKRKGGTQVEKLLVFLAAPSDVPTECRSVGQIVEELNRTVASEKNVVLEVVRSENDAFPGYGQDAQALINAQIAEMAKYALFVGIMWNSVGTPTPRATSGTIEEFERAVQAQNKLGNLRFGSTSVRLHLIFIPTTNCSRE